VGLSLAAAIGPGQRVLVDTSVVLAYLTGEEAVERAATQLFDDFFASGRDRGVISTVTVGEVLVRPFTIGPAPVATIDGFFQQFADLEVVSVDYAIAREAARVRATTGLRMPDAIILATSRIARCDVLCTNDAGLAGAADRLGVATCRLSEVEAG
jgi:predicted nucleic acid-binding protein